MRFPRLASTAAAVSLGMIGAIGLCNGPAMADAASPTAPHSMAGMDQPAATAPAPPPDRAAAIRRSRLKPLFLAAKMDGRQEVQAPGEPAVGDPDGSATGLVRVQGDRVTFAFSWRGITAPTLGHIHRGDAGTNGAVAVPLFGTAMPETVTAAAGVITVSDPATADALRANPRGFYLNLHTKQFPGGAVRGQLDKLRQRTDLLGLLNGGAEDAFLSGDQEVPVAGGPAVGDPSGLAVAHFSVDGGNVGYSFAWAGIAPTLAHIHKGTFGVNGPVVVPLLTSAVPAGVLAVSGTVAGVDPTLAKDITDNPASFYANLHSAQFPGGAVRGQIFAGRHRDGGAAGPAPAATDNAATQGLTATSATLDSGKNLTEPNGSEGISGPGCQNVTHPDNVSSIDAEGTYKIWSGPNCTGRSRIVTGPVRDLDAIGFDKAVASIRFK